MLAAMRYGVFMTGNDLYRFCQDRSRETCMAYVMGAHDMQDEIASTDLISSAFCPGDLTTPTQQMDVVTAFLRDHPEKRDQSAPSLIVEALRAAFPCTTPRP